MIECTAKFSMGRLACGAVRNYLNEQIFMGIPIKYYESTGFFSHDFIIKGLTADVVPIVKTIEAWSEE